MVRYTRNNLGGFFMLTIFIIITLLAQTSNSLDLDYYAEPQTGQPVSNCTYDSSTVINCDGTKYMEQEHDSGWRELVDLLMSIFLVLFAGMMSGLTMGLLSLDMTNLKIIAKSGDAKTQKYAKRIMPLVRKHHFLLVTLLTANAIAMEALPLFLDRLVGPLFAIILSVTLVLLFGEYIFFLFSLQKKQH